MPQKTWQAYRQLLLVILVIALSFSGVSACVQTDPTEAAFRQTVKLLSLKTRAGYSKLLTSKQLRIVPGNETWFQLKQQDNIVLHLAEEELVSLPSTLFLLKLEHEYQHYLDFQKGELRLEDNPLKTIKLFMESEIRAEIRAHRACREQGWETPEAYSYLFGLADQDNWEEFADSVIESHKESYLREFGVTQGELERIEITIYFDQDNRPILGD